MLLLLFLLIAPKAFGFALGFAALDGGDDRYRPALHLQAEYKTWRVSSTFTYQKVTPIGVTEMLIGGSQTFDLPLDLKPFCVHASAGISLLGQYFELNANPANLKKNGQLQDTSFNTNLGVNAGLHLSYPLISNKVYLALNWEHHYFPAGLQGILFLVTGRKQILSCNIGYAL